MVKNEPLKGKMFCGNGKAYLGAFAKEDIKSAMEWLKDKIDYAQKDFANLEVIDKEVAINLILEAFEDVTIRDSPLSTQEEK